MNHNLVSKFSRSLLFIHASILFDQVKTVQLSSSALEASLRCPFLSPPRLPHLLSMYFPSPLPTTRLSLSTSFTPLGPASSSRPSTPYRTPGRPPKGKFKGDSLGGVQEEEGEEVLAIVKGPTDDNNERDGARTLWAVLGREEVSVWSTRVSFYFVPSQLDCARILILRRKADHRLRNVAKGSSGETQANSNLFENSRFKPLDPFPFPFSPHHHDNFRSHPPLLYLSSLDRKCREE